MEKLRASMLRAHCHKPKLVWEQVSLAPWKSSWPGASIPPEAMMHFPSVSYFPLFSKEFSDSVENFPNFTKTFAIFIRQNFWWPFLFSPQPQISSLFSLFQYISPLFRENYSFLPTFKIPPRFRKIYVFFTYFVFFFSPSCLTMMHLCITQCTYWSPLLLTSIKSGRPIQELSMPNKTVKLQKGCEISMV